MIKITISLEEEALQFLDRSANSNRSIYINSLLLQQRRQALETEMIAALLKDAEDPEYLEEIAIWDSIVGDGIAATESLH
jgi:hypothetical protein